MLIDELLHQKQESNHQEQEPQKNHKTNVSAVSLHKYVWGLMGIGILFFATFPIACWRVAQSEKFDRQPLQTLTWGENQKSNLNYPQPK